MRPTWQHLPRLMDYAAEPGRARLNRSVPPVAVHQRRPDTSVPENTTQRRLLLSRSPEETMPQHATAMKKRAVAPAQSPTSRPASRPAQRFIATFRHGEKQPHIAMPLKRPSSRSRME